MAMAANQPILTLESVAFLGAEGLGVAAATVVGQCFGRGRPEDARRAGAFAALASAVVLGAFGLLTWATGQWTVPLFVAPGEDGSALMALAALTLPILALEQPIMAAAMVLGHALRGAGDTRSPVVTAVVGGLVLRLSCSWLFAVTWGWGLRGIWLATALDWFVRTLILGAIFARGRWQSLKL
ncbi:Na+-driven multidrug efflux protein [Plesiocystis pacifica SIR-1]|uniref:Na+-driven multidrug efflux protein n=2 Tax=Plesiocystis pacifica TaxID=191768 RepID=A6GGW1_9BACT|nr:Na+-driven multidrug efflux protein [Plesiocystis pacifica SIR-1]